MLYSTLQPLLLSYRSQRSKLVEALVCLRRMQVELSAQETSTLELDILLRCLERSIEDIDIINREGRRFQRIANDLTHMEEFEWQKK